MNRKHVQLVRWVLVGCAATLGIGCAYSDPGNAYGAGGTAAGSAAGGSVNGAGGSSAGTGASDSGGSDAGNGSGGSGAGNGSAGSGANGSGGSGANGSGGSGANGSGGSGANGSGGSGANGSGGSGANGSGGSGAGGSGGSGANGSGGSGANGSGGSGAGGSGGACSDVCPAPNGGVTWDCEKRFMYGVNYAWNVFGGDFGGIPAWGENGVSQNVAAVSADLADMHAHGVGVIRWWMFPDFRSAGVTIDSSGTPTGLGGTAVADINKALELAQQNDVYLMFTLFSFDDFKPTTDMSGVHIPSITPMVTDSTKRAALMDVVKQVAKIVQASPYANRMVAWDVINEPEWAISGSDPYGDPAFTPQSGTLDTVTFSQMETFVKDTIAALRSESSALVTVGGSAAKWAKDWAHVDVDFYSLHIYDWVDQYWPYSNPPSTYGLNKPIVMQEMSFTGLNGTSYGAVVQSFWSTGYAGAMPWMWGEASTAEKNAFKAFADKHSCQINYSQASPLIITPAPAPAARTATRTLPAGVVPSLRRCRVLPSGRPDCSILP